MYNIHLRDLNVYTATAQLTVLRMRVARVARSRNHNQ